MASSSLLSFFRRCDVSSSERHSHRLPSGSATTLPAGLSLIERIHLSEFEGMNDPRRVRRGKVYPKKRARPQGRALQGASRSPIGEEILKAGVIVSPTFDPRGQELSSMSRYRDN